MTGNPPDLVADLRGVRESLLAILAALPDRPSRLRLRAGEIVLELRWPAPRAGAGAVTDPAEPAKPAMVTAEPPATLRVCAPSVGTFYRRPEPGADPFVTENDTVTAGQQVGIVEAMKLMLPVRAEHTGRVVAILKRDGEPVEYGEPLITLEPVGG